MYRELIALSLAVTATAPMLGAQSLTRGAVGFGALSAPNPLAPQDDPAMASRANTSAARGALLPPPPVSQGASLARFMVFGAAFGMLAGGIYGVHEAVHCDECFPGAQVLFVPYGMMGGAAIGAVAGGVSWVVSRPFTGRG